MARLTWQNVDAPDLGRAADILNSAALQIGTGGGGIANAARNARKDFMDKKSAEILPILAGVSGSGDVAGALAKIDPTNLNEEARAAYMGLMGTGMGFDKDRVAMDGTRAATASVRGAEGRAGTEFARGIAREDQAAGLAGEIERTKEAGRYGPQGNRGANGIPDNERDLLALTLQAEAGGEGYNGMLAAGSVVANRVKSGKYGVGFGGVITKPGQFSYLNGVTGYAGGEGAIDPSNIRVSDDAYAAADAIMSGKYEDQTGGATHYYNDKVADPAWGANKAGGDWVRVGNHVFGSPDGKAPSKGSAGTGESRMSDVIPENNLLPPSFWDAQGDDLWANEEEGYQRGRSRTADALEDSNVAAATALAESVAKSATFEQDIPALVAKSGAPLEVQNRALATLESAATKAQFALPYDPTTTGGGSAVETSLAEADTLRENFVNTDPTMRIQSNARDYESDPAVSLATNLGGTDEQKGEMVDAIGQLVSAAKQDGLTISPSEAASLLYESAEMAGFSAALVPGFQEWGGAYVDGDKALELAKAHLTPEQKRKGARLGAETAAAEEEAKLLRQQLGEISGAKLRADNKGNTEESDRLQKMLDEKTKQALEFEKKYTFYPKREDGEAAGAGAAKPSPAGAAATPADPLQAATLEIADSALQAATDGGIDLAGLANASTEMQVRVLDAAIENLKQNAGSAEQIAVLEQLLQEAITADAAASNSP